MNTRLLSGSGLLIALVLFVAINIIGNATLTSWRLDLTANRLYSLSEGTRNILASLEEPVTLRYYFTAGAFAGIPPLQNYGVRVREMLEEYVTRADGQIELIVIEPEPFSEAEDQAVAFGIQQLPISGAGDIGYFGLVGTNSTDDQEVIPIFQPNREQSLEYELTKLVYDLAHPRDRVIGVISTLPIFGAPGNPMTGGQPTEPWTVLTLLRDAYEVRDLGRETSRIGDDVDTLLVIHPKDLGEETRYAIDQFVLKGGKAMVFVDPLAEEDQSQLPMQAQMMLPERGSDLPGLLEKWGVRLREGKVAGDIEAAIRVGFQSSRGPREIEYLPWLQLESPNFNSDDFVTNQLSTINMGSAGILERVEGAGTEVTPLISTGANAMAIERDALIFVRDPTGLLESFKPEGQPFILAARIRGKAATAFPDGKPGADSAEQADEDAAADEAGDDPDFVKESAEPINVIVVADTDVLADRFWVQVQSFLGIRMPTPIADNASFLVNSVDNLGGNDDLISLRSRGESLRPFDRVEDLRRLAEAQYRDKEQALQARLEETESKLAELQKERDPAGKMLLSPAQRTEIEKFRAEQLRTRRELRAVQHDLQKNIDRLGTILKFVNIGAIPLLIGLFATALGAAQWLRRARERQHPMH
jgi:ABC-type uncharacterized transport system involved in gliding motility auxiliary subunit